MESKRWQEKIKTMSEKARKVAKVAGELITAGESEHDKLIRETREKNTANPDLYFLYLNKQYKKWLTSEIKPSETYRDSMFDSFERVKNVQTNPYVETDLKISPDLSDETLQKMSEAFCREKSNDFLKRSAEIAKVLSDPDTNNQDKYMEAISKLIGTPMGHYDATEPTLFYDTSWHTANYQTVFDALEVKYEQVGMDKEKTMAGVRLAAGLWVRLADMDAVRPVSGANFAPPMQHCSFISLVMDSGWLDYSHQTEAFAKAHAASWGTESTDSEFLDQFRRPEFFAHVARDLEAA